MSSYSINVFISHAWNYSEVYNTLEQWIFKENWNVDGVPIYFKDYSIPKHNPIHHARTERELQDAIFNEISKSHVIVIPTGMYSTYSRWIQKEIDGAKGWTKPILAVNPRGQERISGVVADNADEHVGWTKKSVVDGIWNLYRSNY